MNNKFLAKIDSERWMRQFNIKKKHINLTFWTYKIILDLIDIKIFNVSKYWFD